MKSRFFYPKLSDRRSLNDWLTAGAGTIEEAADKVADQILAEHYPNHVSAKADAAIRQAFDIRLPEERCARAPSRGVIARRE